MTNTTTNNLYRQLAKSIGECMCTDVPRLLKRLRAVQLTSSENPPGQLEKEESVETLEARLKASMQKVEARTASVPDLTFPELLPISAHVEEIVKLIQSHQVVIICGETGSGKSTQLPKIALLAGRGRRGLIGHTQPRRLAARSLATRIAEEIGDESGAKVGYQIRFSSKIHHDTTLIKLMTDGILLAEIPHDRWLNRYDTLIIDEAHERSLNIDFILGYLKTLLVKRPELKVIITSATIDPGRFSRHFDAAPIVEVSGRGYPVEVRYRPAGEDESTYDLPWAVLQAVHEISQLGQQDILVFLPSERVIREVSEQLHGARLRHTEIVPLFGRLGIDDQMRIFRAHTGRRIVLATNVAETSLTVPGIHYVIDSGLVRVSRYSYRNKIQRLPVEWVSQASANQRAGRCGRIAPGVCIRLYSEEDYLSAPEHTDPEILRTHLSGVILRMKSLRLGEIESFPFLESPDGRYIRDGYKQLQELQAIDEKGHLTRLGKQMARLPLEPSLARMLLAAVDLGVLDDVLIIVSGLEAQDPRDRPLDKQAAADEAHQQFQHPRSDFLTLLALWRTFQEKSAQLSQNKARKWCQENFISWRRLREWEDVWRQLAGLCAELRQGGAPERVNLTRPQKSGHRNDANRLVSQVESDREGRSTTSQSEPDYAAIHQALLTGLLSNVAVIEEKDLYLGTRSARFRIFPDSTLLKRKPKWLMAAELIETSAQFARMGAEIEPRWVEEAAQHLVHRHLHSPWWDAKKGRVSAYERITLYGLLLNPRRKVDLTTRDPVMAHELFIREALVARKLEKRYPFYLANNQLIDQVRLMESKIRRQDLLVEEDAIYALYAERIPQEVVSVSTLSKWLMQNPGAEKRLFFDFDMLLLRDPDRDVAVRFPDKMEVEGVPLPLSYCFEPGNEADGVTVSLPLSLLGRINAARLSWGVPGIWEEKITEMIRVLPKTIRRRLVPAPDFARKASLLLTEDASRFFTEAVAYGLGQLAQIPLDPQVWAEATIPEHLLMRIAVVEDSGAILATGRNLDELKRHFAEDLERLGKGMLHQNWQKTDIVVWDFGEIPEQVETTVGGVAVSGWPCLAVDNGRVSLMLETDRQRADERMREGVARLIQHIHKKEIKSFLREREVEEILIQYSGLGKVEAMANSLVEAIYRTVYARSDASMPRNAQQFDHYIREHRLQLHETRCRYCSLLKEAVELYRQVRLAMKQEVPLGLIRIVQEIRDHVDRLVYDRFLDDVSLVQLQHYPRYLKASLKRIEKLRSDPKRDNQRAALVEPLEKQFQQWLQRHPDRVGAEPVLHYRWLLEEWRVSVFAQELGTAEPVSEKRLSRLWAEIDRPEYRY